MGNLIDRLFYWWEDITRRFGSRIMAVLFLITFLSVSWAVIECGHSRDLENIIEAYRRMGEAERLGNEKRLLQKDQELNRLKILLRFMRDRSDSTVKASVNGIDLDAPYPYPAKGAGATTIR